jgi:hypothetical protein
MKTTRGILLLAVLALTRASAFAAPASSEWTGTVAAISGDDLSLIGIPVHFRIAGPVLVALSGRTVRSGDLAAGSAVTVTAAEREADGRMRATAVRVRAKNPFNLTGTVSRVADDRRHVEVEGVSIGLDDRTAFSGRNASGGSVRSAADLRAGMTVRVALTASSSGELRGVSLAASEPEPQSSDDQEIKGTVTSVSDTLWKVDGRDFVVDASTVFVGDPAVGDFVEVRFHSDGQGHDVADRIAKEDANENEFELRGVVEAIGATSWTISGQVVLVNESTQIVGAPAVGDSVEAEGSKAPDGTLTAHKIQKEDAQDETEVEFTGKVESISADTWTVAGRKLTVNDATQIEGDPEVGDTVEVKANQAADGSLTATRIHAEDGGNDDHGGNGGNGGNDDPPGDDNGGSSGSGSGGGHHGAGGDDPAGDD